MIRVLENAIEVAKEDARIVVVDLVEVGALKRVMGTVKMAVWEAAKTFARTLHPARLPTNRLPITIHHQVAAIALEDVKTVAVLDAEIHVRVVVETIVQAHAKHHVLMIVFRPVKGLAKHLVQVIAKMIATQIAKNPVK